MNRAQMNLPALAVALLVVTAVAVVSFGMADRAFVSADRDADERRVAVALSERLVGAETPLTARPNVLDADELDGMDAERLRSLFPVVDERDVRVRLGNRTLAESGDPTGGTAVRRIVLVEDREEVSLTPDLSADEPTVTLPRRSPRARLAIDPPEETTVTVVRANDRVVLRNASGLSGAFEVRLSEFETTALTFESEGDLSAESVEVTYYPAETRKELLAVTVDA
ncbi:hypothetical protein NGM10_05650 [Halorussus salilacus]|uniref:DUF7263 family protein n=1 Tax=Halorussus salilacus TaxID=2953750 RepID=UPI0020A0BF75|nr:hypothetical protein [Halorussus salilacus]USZ69224.1 hypothetical protein NGM10_05650 [Halorussus salilacus]